MILSSETNKYDVDFSDVRGLENINRALFENEILEFGINDISFLSHLTSTRSETFQSGDATFFFLFTDLVPFNALS